MQFAELTAPQTARAKGVNYKYQRLREQLRRAVARGELAGKLPGERALAKQFHANAKTLSKALTDLAAEGVLDRSVGRGTYVKGAQPAPLAGTRWMLICDEAQAQGPIARAIIQAHPDAEVVLDSVDLRPSFVNRFAAALVLSRNVSESLLRDLTIRNMPLLLVNREPATCSVRAVVMDIPLAAARLARKILLDGHRRIFVVEPAGSTLLIDTLHLVAQKIVPEGTTLDRIEPRDMSLLSTLDCSAVVCASPEIAERAQQIVREAMPQQRKGLSINAIGCSATPACDGFFVSPGDIAQACVDFLKDASSSTFCTARPATLWLAPSWREPSVASPEVWTSHESDHAMREGTELLEHQNLAIPSGPSA